MASFEDYRDRFRHVRFTRDGGVLEIAIHTDGGPCLWDANRGGVHDELGAAFGLVAQDPEVRAVILTGTGEVFCTEVDMKGPAEPFDAVLWDRVHREGRALLMNLLAIEVPVVGAVNGDAFIHAELVALSDIVVAAEGARFADKGHTLNGWTPADGVHVVWPMLLGANRGRHFLLTGAEIEAAEAKRIGFVAEVVPRAALSARAWSLAQELARKPRLMARYSRIALTLEIRRRLSNDLGYGLALEGLGALALVTGADGGGA